MDIASLSAVAGGGETPRAAARLTQNFDTFLTLLTTQLRNQDPLKPLDTEKFTEQLVQFASVEQSIETNQHLQALIDLQTTSENETALSLIGRIATIDSDVSALTDKRPAQWRYHLPEQAAAVTLNIVDPRGAVVASFEGLTSAGAQSVSWDGRGLNGERLAAGAYALKISALNQQGQAMNVPVSTSGRVDAASFENGSPMIEIAGHKFALDAVLRVDAEADE